ncbi:two-component system, OmpR family, response regulator [Deferribacter desulfuricans SSM1]|uniref:Two-component system, OmpR family, response regulator n=1 Tax=Deferribacter desulfuricans (strain DSM 14783 / JCM 11476 / NBRC 101012 / SSM1) TaxID=639282 RepID=D3PBC6_DEFDS|nr:response regulator transcription factor [Deferribacter desulfuricans]BAI79899.1 two-component system, OmpR family, response regulator [Deferribacter desulfuricans SSM1]
MATVLVIEDEDSLREIISFNLKKAGFNCIEAADANDALIILDQLLPDLILLDLMLPGLKGTQFLKILKDSDKFSKIPVIIISAKDEETTIVAHLELGAIDYLTKPFSIKVLIAKVNKFLSLGNTESTDNLKFKNIEIDEKRAKVLVDNKEVNLTHKEFLLLKLFIQHPGRVYTRDELLSHIWGYDSAMMTRTVDAHISSLRKKLGKSGNKIKTIPKIGYKFE